MCGRFTQYHLREKHPSFFGEEVEWDIPYDSEPVGRYNAAPGTRVLLLGERRSQLQPDPVHWEYASEQWNKPVFINARSETVIGSRMFRPLWEYRRVIVFADGRLERKQQSGVKQSFFIYRKNGNLSLLVAVRRPFFENGNDQEGFLIVIAATNEGLLDIHDRRLLTYLPAVVRRWSSENTTGKEAEGITCEGSLPAEDFTWHLVSWAVDNPRSQGRELIEPLVQQTEICPASTHRATHRFCE